MSVESTQNGQLFFRAAEYVCSGDCIEPAVYHCSLLVAISLVEAGGELTTDVAGDVCNASDGSLVVGRDDHSWLGTRGSCMNMCVREREGEGQKNAAMGVWGVFTKTSSHTHNYNHRCRPPNPSCVKHNNSVS